ncbi:MAG: HU family DNA-binding protein [Gemmataceae bacterium]|nr:HU family DNA-binding protein [Gemmataceae bacterium]
MAKTKADKKGGNKAAAKPNKKGGKGKPATKAAIFQQLAEATNLTRKQVATFFDELTKMIYQDLSATGPGVFTIPNVVRLKRKLKKATPERPGRNPRTGEATTIPAKPESIVPKAYPVKALKEVVK